MHRSFSIHHRLLYSLPPFPFRIFSNSRTILLQQLTPCPLKIQDLSFPLSLSFSQHHHPRQSKFFISSNSVRKKRKNWVIYLEGPFLRKSCLVTTTDSPLAQASSRPLVHSNYTRFTKKERNIIKLLEMYAHNNGCSTFPRRKYKRKRKIK